MKNKKGWIVIAVVIAIVVVGWFLVLNIEYNKTVSLEVVVDPGINSFELFTTKDDRKALVSLTPNQDSQRQEVTLRVYEKIQTLLNRPVVQYYTFIMEKDGQRYQCTDPFNLSDRNARLRLNVGMAGSWEIVNR